MTTIGMSAGLKLLNTVSGGGLGSYPAYGLVMRFEVTVDGLSLGLWQSCRGLDVSLTYKKFESGGQYVTGEWLPEKITYGPVTMERAVEQASSTTLLNWLENYVYKWTSYATKPGGVPPSTSVVIQLLDYQLNPVMKWTLAQARPTKWTGPTLSAADNKVAIEALTFEHEGFL